MHVAGPFRAADGTRLADVLAGSFAADRHPGAVATARVNPLTPVASEGIMCSRRPRPWKWSP